MWREIRKIAQTQLEIFPETTGLSLKQQLEDLKGFIIRDAQEIYDTWDQDGDGIDATYGSGGICDEISEAISVIVSSSIGDIETMEGGQDGDDHAYLVVYNDKEAYEIDIPYHIYETGGGYSWKKIPDVVFHEGMVEIHPIEIDRSSMQEYG
jgi:hypothetical protein